MNVGRVLQIPLQIVIGNGHGAQSFIMSRWTGDSTQHGDDFSSPAVKFPFCGCRDIVRTWVGLQDSVCRECWTRVGPQLPTPTVSIITHAKMAPKRRDIFTWFDLLDLDDYVSFGGQA